MKNLKEEIIVIVRIALSSHNTNSGADLGSRTDKADKITIDFLISRILLLLREERKKWTKEAMRIPWDKKWVEKIRQEEGKKLAGEIEKWANKNKFPFEVCAKIEEFLRELLK